MANSTEFFEQLRVKNADEHERTRERLSGKPKQKVSPTRAVAQVTMTKAEKARFMRLAKEHGLGLSPFIRLACDEYIRTHEWE
jgi:hypothetical protein